MKTQPMRIFVEWCRHCGQLGAVVKASQKGLLTGRCGHCVPDRGVERLAFKPDIQVTAAARREALRQLRRRGYL